MHGAPDSAVAAPRSLQAYEQRYQREWWLMALLVLAVLTLCILMRWGQTPGFLLHDQFQRWWPAKPGAEVVVVQVDDRTLQALGGWPLPRTVYADFLRLLADAGQQPRSVGFDILFPDPRPEDALLAEQMRRHRVFLVAEQPRGLVGTEGAAPAVSAVLAGAAQGLAQVNLSFDADGSLRGVRMVEQGVPQLALAMSGHYWPWLDEAGGYRRLHMIDPRQGVRGVSLVDVLAGQVPLSVFKDRHVLLGATAPSLGDHFATLYSGRLNAGTPGVMLHANLLDNLLQQQLISPVPVVVQLVLVWLAVGSVLLGLLWLGPLAEFVLVVAVALGLLALSCGLLVGAHLWFDPGLALLAMGLIKPAWSWRRTEMVVSFMHERASLLDKARRAGAPQVRHWRSDSLLAYSRWLDQAISTVNDRLWFLQRLVAEVPLPMLVCRGDGRLLQANAAMLAAVPMGLLREGQALQGLLGYLGLVSHNLQMLAGQDHVVRSGEAGQESRHFILRVAPISGDAQPLWVLSLTDVTELQRFQAQREQTLELLSHDMRTPVASIMALARGAQAQGSMRAGDVLGHARTLLDMMDDFIFSIQAQAPRYRWVERPLDTLVDEAMYQVRDLARAAGMELVFAPGDEPLLVRVDERLFTRVLVNLLVNAVRHGEPGSPIHVEISHESPDEAEDWVRCTVSNVVATAPADAAAETGRSFGLGLDFVRQVVQRHQGRLVLELTGAAGSMARVALSLPVLR